MPHCGTYCQDNFTLFLKLVFIDSEWNACIYADTDMMANAIDTQHPVLYIPRKIDGYQPTSETSSF
jgi:hypothetical protein